MNRIHEIDALRGIALFGILLVNIFIFNAPYSYYGEIYGAYDGIQGQTVNWVVDFAGGKFLFLFAFLFGYGIYLQEQSQSKGFTRLYFRRMCILFVIGLLHILLFWFGDILASYALLGMAMLLFIKLPKRLLLGIGILFLLFRPLYFIGCVALDWPMVSMLKPLPMEEFYSLFQTGTYSEIFKVRMMEFWAFMPENLVWFIPKTLGLFIIGYYFAFIGFTKSLKQYRNRFLILAALLLISYGFWSQVKQDFFGSFNLEENPFMRPLLIGVNVFFESVLGFFYIIGFLLIFQNFKRLARFIGKAGRMAMTNYILQSLICVLIFYSYGFGLYGELLPTDLVWVSLLIYAFNLLFSWIYLMYFQQGPLEYLWRKLSLRNKT